MKRLKKQEDRVTDAYINEVMELGRYSVEMDKLRDRRSQLERMVEAIDRREKEQTDRLAALERLDRFCREVSNGLDAMTFEERQQLLRLVVESITVEDERVRIETVIPVSGDDVRLRAHRPEPVEGRARRHRIAKASCRRLVRRAHHERFLVELPQRASGLCISK